VKAGRLAPVTLRFVAALALAAVVSLLLLACSKPEPVEVTPRSISVVGVGPSALDLAVELDVHNPNSFPVWAREVTGTVVTGGVEIARGVAVPTGSIPAKGTATVPATLSAPWTQLGALAPLALSGQPVPFEVRGVVRMGGESLHVDVPFTLSSTLTRAQLMQAGMQGLR
jgi:LEA14-like dessication related protein